MDSFSFSRIFSQVPLPPSNFVPSVPKNFEFPLPIKNLEKKALGMDLLYPLIPKWVPLNFIWHHYDVMTPSEIWMHCKYTRKLAKINFSVQNRRNMRFSHYFWLNMYMYKEMMILISIISLKHISFQIFKGVLHLWALFLKTLCFFLKNKTILDKVSYGSGQKCSKELTNHSFPSEETIGVNLQSKNVQKSIFSKIRAINQ